jgi:EAL domain-containing protein (putative c-di-GMP-specific phosphodiesterase class I)
MQTPLNSKGDIDFEFSFAFQPIINSKEKQINSFEALVRGPHGEPAESILNRLTDENVHRFDEICRWKAITMASRLKLTNRLNINLTARALYQVDLNITATFKASLNSGFPVNNIIFEVIESESLTDRRNLYKNLRLLQEFGFQTAIDDFGMGYSGLKLLLEYQPNYVKVDRYLIANIHREPVKQSVFYGIRKMCDHLSIEMVAEGVEKDEEYKWLLGEGVVFYQGFYFARPAFESLPTVAFQSYVF